MTRINDIEFYAARRRLRAYRKRVFLQELAVAVVLATLSATVLGVVS